MDLKLSFSLPEENMCRPVNYGEVYDVLIIGGGPAGLTAAIYILRKGLNAALLTDNIGGQVLDTKGIENYTGYKFIEGSELADKFFDQIKQFPIAFSQDKKIGRIEKKDNLFYSYDLENKPIVSKTLIIAAGKTYKKLNIPGEREYTGRGVAYCATCDAPLYKNKTVAIIGGGNSGVESALELSSIADRVILFQRRDSLVADNILVEKLKKRENVEIIYNAHIREIKGKDKVDGITYSLYTEEKEGMQKNYVKGVDGVFVEIGLIPNSQFVGNLVRQTPNGEIIVDCGCYTSNPGVFAAGDITTVPEKQIIVAAGEGAKAALSAFKYIMQQK